jgi:hypothetical protein
VSDESQPSDGSLEVPALSQRAIAERRGLLAVSVACIAIGWTGSIPAKISALGIEFSSSNKTAFLRVLTGVVIYFFLAFICYAIPDFMRFKAAWHSAKEQTEATRLANSLGADDDRINLWAQDPNSRPIIKQQLKRELVERRYNWRMLPGAIMDFGVPVLVALVALHSLLAAKV